LGAEPIQSEGDRDEGGFFSTVDRFLDMVTCGVTRGEWIVRTAAGFILAVMFFTIPFTEIGAGEPWYFWVGSGVIAFIVGTLMSWLLITFWKDL
jgi:hypothetical protein